MRISVNQPEWKLKCSVLLGAEKWVLPTCSITVCSLWWIKHALYFTDTSSVQQTFIEDWENFPKEVTNHRVLESDDMGTASNPTRSLYKDDHWGWGRKAPCPSLQSWWGAVRSEPVILATQLEWLTVYHVSLPPSQSAFHRYTSGKVSWGCV